MNLWSWAAIFLAPALLPCAYVALRYPGPIDRLVALQMATVVLVFELVLLTQAQARFPFHDLPLTLVLLSFGSGLTFAHFLARSL